MTKYGQPVISRETRLLLITIVISVGALWLLARLRFQDRPVAVAPVVPVLAQLRPQSNYEDLARSVSDLRPAVFATMAATSKGVAALRVSEEVGVGLVASHLELMQIPEADVPSLATWTPRIFDYPRYLVAVEVVERSLSLRPVFIGSLVPVESRDWNGSIWRLPQGAGVSSGTFLFSTEGLLAGVAVEQRGALSLVPAPLVLESAKKLSQTTPRAPGVLGIAVQPTTVGLAVTWVDPAGPAASELMPTDVIESVDGQPVANADDWRARTRAIAKGAEVKLRVRVDGGAREVAIIAATAVEPPEDASLGLHVRTVPRVGVEVLAVEPESRADRAGIRTGDLITVFGGQKAPAAAQVARIFGAARQGKLLVALSRGGEHHVVVIEKIATTP